MSSQATALTGAALLALGLTACTLPPAGSAGTRGITRAKTCTPGHPCEIKVWVDVVDGACRVGIEADHTYVQGGQAAITWTLDPATSQGYEFPRFGVLINEDDAQRPQWTLVPQQSSASAVQWTDRHSAAGTYAYTVLLVKPLGGHEFAKCGPLDPWIHNE